MRVHYDMKYELTDQDIRFFFSAMAEGGAKIDAAGSFLYVGDTYAKMLGHAPSDLLGRAWIDTICVEERDAAQKVRQQVGLGEKILLKTKSLRKDGSSFFSKLTLVSFSEKGGYYCLMQDIDHEHQLERNKEWYRDLYLKTPMMLHSVDKEGCLLNVSNFWLTKLGYDRQEVLGRPLADFMTKESKERFHLAFDYLMKEGCVSVHYQMLKKNGQILNVTLSSVREVDDDGNFLRSFTILQDTTEFHKESELIKKIYDVRISSRYTFEEKIQKILEFGLSYLGLDYAFVGQVKDGDYILLQSTTKLNEEMMEVGTTIPLKETYCEAPYRLERVVSYQP